MSCITNVVGKGKIIGNSNGKGVSDTYNIVMVDRWIMYYNGSWYFKIDNDRISRALDCSTIRGVQMLKDSILQEYGMLGRLISGRQICECLCDIHGFFGKEMIFLRPEQVLMLESITYVGMVDDDDDEILVRHV
ncbi:hypothetical protein YC2023_051088 [Brassica napus]